MKARCQPDVRKPFRTVLPLACILAALSPPWRGIVNLVAEREAKAAEQFDLTHYPPVGRTTVRLLN